MPPFYHEDPDQQQGIFDGVDRNTQTWMVAYDIAANDPALALRAAQLHAYYGNSGLPPGVSMAMAQEGIAPGSPQAEVIAQEAAIQDNDAQTTDEGFVAGLRRGFDWLAWASGAEAISELSRLGVRGAFSVWELGWNDLYRRPTNTAIASTQDESLGSEVQRWGSTIYNALPSSALSNVTNRVMGALGDQEPPPELVTPESDPWAFNPSQIYENYKQSGESPLVSAIRERVETGNMNVGSGYFIGEQALDRANESNQLYLPNGEKITLGRAHAQVFEPGTIPYNLYSGTIDAAAAIALDPANIGLVGAANIADARRAFKLPGRGPRDMDDVRAYFGAFAKGARVDTDPSKYVQRFLREEKKGDELVHMMAGLSDEENIWQILGRPSNRGISVALADETDPEGIIRILEGSAREQTGFRGLSVDIRNRPKSVRNLNVRTANMPLVRRSIQDMRLFDEIPGRTINFENPDETFETFNQMLKNSNLSTLRRKQLFSKYARMRPGDRKAMDEIMIEYGEAADAQIAKTPQTLGGAVSDVLAEALQSVHMNERVVKMMLKIRDDFEMGSTRDIWTPQGGPVSVKVGNSIEFMNAGERAALKTGVMSTYPMTFDVPDIRMIRRATSRLAPLLDTGLLKATEGVLGSYMKLWKPLQLLRLAWTVRVVGEEQIRMAGQGLSSGFRDPLDWVAWTIATADDSRLARALSRAGIDEKGGQNLLHEAMNSINEHQGSMSSRYGAWAGELPGGVRTGDLRRVVRQGRQKKFSDYVVDDDEFATVAWDNLRPHVLDDVSRNLALGDEFEYRLPGTGFDEELPVVYHGTPRYGEPFQLQAGPGEPRVYGMLPNSRMGTYFSENPEYAEGFAGVSMWSDQVANDEVLQGQFIDRLVGMDTEEMRALFVPAQVEETLGRNPAGRLDELLDEHEPEIAKRIFAEEIWREATSGFTTGRTGVFREILEEIVPRRGNVFRANLKVENPYEVDGFDILAREAKEHYVQNVTWDEFLDDLSDFERDVMQRRVSNRTLGGESLEDARHSVIKEYTQLDRVAMNTPEMADRAGQMYKAKLQADGFDGVHQLDEEQAWIAFDDSQIVQEHFDADPLQGMDAVKAWLWHSDEGQQIRKTLADSSGRDSLKRALFYEDAVPHVQVNQTRMFENVREATDYYVESHVWKSLKNLAGNDDELMSAVATGQLGGIDVRGATLNDTKQIVQEMSRHIDNFPNSITGYIQDPTKARKVETLFEMLMGARTDRLSRSPAFRQFYYQRVDEVMAQVNPELADEILDAGKATNVSINTSGIGTSQKVVIDTMEDLDTVAKQYALGETRKLLYDLDRRGQWTDILRNILPFAEAWKEVLGTWFRLLRQRPQNIRRGQQVISSARGHDTDPTTGFFFSDENGNEKFAYPFVGRAMSGILNRMGYEGVNVAAHGEVQNLNLVTGSMLPGFGPIAALFASALIPDTPDWDWARNTFLPFGEEKIEGSLGEWLEVASLPAWMERGMVAAFGDDKSDRQFANTRMSLAQSMINSGRYEPDEIEQALDDSLEAARVMYTLRSIAQFGLPTGPIIEYELEDQNGEYHQIGVLASELRAMAEKEGSYDAAIPTFVEVYGIDPFLVSQPSTRTIKERSFTEAGWAWERTNADHLNSLDIDHVVGYFAPIDVDDESFAYDAWADALTKGHSQALTSEEQLRMYNSAAGMYQYRAMKERLEAVDMPEEERRQHLTHYRAFLRAARPGFDTISDSLGSRPDYDILIEELERGVNDPLVGGTPAGQAIRHYLTARQQALAVADGTSLEGVRDQGLRIQLYQFGREVAASVKDFENVWLEVFSREVRDAEEFLNQAENPENPEVEGVR